MPKPWWKRVGVLMAVLIVGSAAYFCANYIHHDQETEDLSDAARRGTGGSYVRLSDGVTHYELAGPENARTVVLVHGFSVPYYLWDPTFTALVKAGMRTLRYDLYGRGYSDRPAEIYDADLYEDRKSVV